MTTVEQARKRKRRTFTMEDESYERLTMYAQRATPTAPGSWSTCS